mgnify:CR=1 FL=1
MADLKISQLSAATALAGTEVVPVVQGGSTKKATIDQILSPAALKGINFAANTPAAGMTSQLLNWYEEGTWTPAKGAGVTTVGAFSSTGTYTRIGRQVTVRGELSGATSIAIAAANIMVTNLPYSVVDNCAGSMSSGVSVGGTCNPIGGSTTLYASTALAASSSAVIFTATYFV